MFLGIIGKNIAIILYLVETIFLHLFAQRYRFIVHNYKKKYQYKLIIINAIIYNTNYFKLYGMYTAKLALAVVLAGGVPKCNESGIYSLYYHTFYSLYKIQCVIINKKKKKEHVCVENLIFFWSAILELVNPNCFVQHLVWL